MKDVTTAIEAAQNEPTKENLAVMWRRVFRLPAWYLLPSKLDGPATPLVARLDDGDWVVGFTHFRALNEFAREHGMRSEDGEIPMFAMPPQEAMEKLAEVRDHVTGVLFNPGTDFAFRSPMEALFTLAADLLPEG